MDSERSQLISGEAGGGDSAAGETGEDRRVEELLRVNARLAAEVRSLTLGHTEVPRQTAMPAARRLGTVIDERDALTEQLAATRVALEAGRAHRQELERVNADLNDVVQNLRAGPHGLLRRVFARLHRYFRQ